jgi:hypothetical protein
MRWQVEGADKVTGRERTYTIDAETREKAEQIAQQKGVLVSDVHEPLLAKPGGAGNGASVATAPSAATLPATPIDVHGPITTPPARAQPAPSPTAPPQPAAATARAAAAHTAPPRYDEIVTSSRWLYAIGVLVAIAGWVLIGLAAIDAAMNLIGVARGHPLLPPSLGWMSALYLGAIGLLAIYTAAMTRLLASLGLAVRDMARNSFL